VSVVAWDGRTLAADRQSTNHGNRSEVQKLWRAANPLTALAVTGGIAEGLAMVEWYKAGADPASYPAFQNDSGRWTRLIVVTETELLEYEQPSTPIRWRRQDKRAWGSGRDYAIGAMAAGASAREAVEITNAHCTETGFGVSTFAFPATKGAKARLVKRS